MKKAFYISLIFFLISLISCNSPPKGQFEKENGIFLDTPYNRNMHYNIYNAQIDMEASKLYPNNDWVKGWKRNIRALRSGSFENPEHIVGYIIKERRKRGLPELNL